LAERVLGFAEALAEVLRQAASVAVPGELELVALKEATGRVLARAVLADALPPQHARWIRRALGGRGAHAARGWVGEGG